VWLLVKLWYVLLLVVIALVIVGTFRPIVAWLEAHRLPRFVALGIVFVAVTGAVFLVGLLTVPVLIAQLLDILEKAPGLQANIATEMRRSALLRPIAASVRSFDLGATVSGLQQHLFDWSSHAVVAIGQGVTTFFLALYVMADREQEQGALFALVPRRYHLRLARVMASLETIVGGYVRGQVMTSLFIGVYTFGLLAAFGAPNAVAYGVFAALTDVIPFVGGLIATTPAVLSALGQGVTPALVVLAAMVIYQAFESRILVPRVYGRVLRLSPALVIVALLVGGTLMGLLGALLALPVAAGLRTLIKDLRVELPGEAETSVGLLNRDAAAEIVYAERTEGATAVDAAAIAGTMMAEVREADAALALDASEAASDASSPTGI
jgi:predicted PurR-regulated permease PerM